MWLSSLFCRNEVLWSTLNADCNTSFSVHYFDHLYQSSSFCRFQMHKNLVKLLVLALRHVSNSNPLLVWCLLVWCNPWTFMQPGRFFIAFFFMLYCHSCTPERVVACPWACHIVCGPCPMLPLQQHGIVGWSLMHGWPRTSLPATTHALLITPKWHMDLSAQQGNVRSDLQKGRTTPSFNKRSSPTTFSSPTSIDPLSGE